VVRAIIDRMANDDMSYSRRLCLQGLYYSSV